MEFFRLAVIGTARQYSSLLDALASPGRRDFEILLLVDPDSDSDALERAARMGIPVAQEPQALISVAGLDVVLDFQGDVALRSRIEPRLPPGVEWSGPKAARCFCAALGGECAPCPPKASPQSRPRDGGEIRAEGIIYGSPTPMFVIDKHHKVAYWNKACEELTGFRSEDMIGTDRHWEPFYRRKRLLLADVLVDNDPETLRKIIRNMNLRRSDVVEGAYETEYYVRNLGKYLYIIAAPILDDHGDIQGAIVTYQDFSERVRMTQALKASREETEREKKKAEGILHGSPIPMFVLNRDHRIIYWNKAVENLTGYTREEMVGTNHHWKPFFPYKRPLLADLIIDQDFDRIQHLYRNMKLRRSQMVEGAWEAEHFFPHLGPEGTHLYFNAAPIQDEGGRIQGAIITYQDFTERERMIREIRNRENFVQNLIENSIDGIIATGPRGKITIFNRVASEILGYSPEETIGRMSYPEILPRETAAMIRKSFYGEQYGPPGKIVHMEVKFLNKENEAIPARFSGTLLYEQNREVGSVVFMQDLREIRRLQREKEQAQRMAAIGRTVAGVAHYIKNVLTGLNGGAYVINSGMSKDDLDLVRKGWGMVKRNVDQISHIVTDMLIYSSDRQPDYRPTDPNAVVRDVLALLEERARLSGVSLNVRLAEDLPSVNMDPTGIYRCLLNLVGNAVDACTLEGIVEGNGEVSVKTEAAGHGGVRFTVTDNGIGISPETQERLFTDFFTTKGYKGTGLGLPVTQKIVQEHRGHLDFESRPGEGATFTIVLPKTPLGTPEEPGT